MLEKTQGDGSRSNSFDENAESDSNSIISNQSNNTSFSYNNMTYIKDLVDNEENDLGTFPTNENNKNIQNIQNLSKNTNLNNAIYEYNFNDNLVKFQQLYPLYFYNQYLLLNKQIQEYILLQKSMNLINNNLNKRITNLEISKQNQNLKKRKNEAKKNSTNKAKPPKPENEIIIKNILLGQEKRTFVRLSPIPNKYSPFDIVLLIDKILKTKKGQRIYNSVYVPLAKVIGKNKGYCFINLVSPKYVVKFYGIFNGLYLNSKKCKKPCSVVFSDKQNIDYNNDDPLRRPIVFHDVVKN